MIRTDPKRFDHAVPLTLGSRSYDLSGRALIMGIVNRVSDSFFDNGQHFDLDAAVRQAEGLAGAGADIIDIGGVRAGAGPEVTAQEEMDRLIPAIEAIVVRTGLPVSVDTWRASVVEESFRAGAVLGNDISGFADPGYLPTAVRYGASVVVTHTRPAPPVDDPDSGSRGNDVVTAVEEFFLDRLGRAREVGLGDDRVIFDAGLDLGKTTQHSLELLGASSRLASHGPALLLSVSNTRFLGELFGYPAAERQDATVAAVALGVTLGCRVLRVHNAESARRACRTIEAVLAS
jgi:dihydropteroate synthase